MNLGLRLPGVAQLSKTFETIEREGDRLFRGSLRPVLKYWRLSIQAAYAAAGLRLRHNPIKVAIATRTLALRIPGGQFFEYGTGAYRTEPYSPKSRRSLKRGPAPWAVKAKKAKVLLGPAETGATYRTWKGRPIFGIKALVPGMERRPVLPPLMPRLIADIPDIAGPEILAQIDQRAQLGRKSGT